MVIEQAIIVAKQACLGLARGPQGGLTQAWKLPDIYLIITHNSYPTK